MVRSLLEAILLGVVQGLTEFIPVSSSGHLVIVPHLLGLEDHGLAYDVALHVGTLGAVIVFFRAEIWAMTRGLLGLDRSQEGLVHRRLALFVAAGTVPVAIVGLALEDVIAGLFGAPLVTSSLLFVTAGLLFVGERMRDRRVHAWPVPSHTNRRDRGRPAGEPAGSHHDQAQERLRMGRDPGDPAGSPLDRISISQALLVGLGQCLALLPGVSRSGTTIVTGMAVGMTREAATRFSFLLALPALVGASVLSFDDLVAADRSFSNAELVAGVGSAFLSGYLAIRFLVALVARKRLTGFAWYCIGLGLVGVVVFGVLA